MMHCKALLAAGVCALVFSAPGYAAENGGRWPRWYVGGTVGMQFLSDSDLGGSQTGTVEFDNGYTFSGSIGYRPYFGVAVLDDMRVEFEAGYREAGLDSRGNTPLTGDLRVTSYMGNLFYDIPTGSRFTPYIGAGAGAARVSLPRTSGLGNTDSKDSTFAYQGLLGVSYAPTSIPLTEWTLGYRYFRLQDPQFQTLAGNVKLKDVDSHNVELGARFLF